MTYHRKTWIEVDLDAIAYNINQAKRLNPGKTLIAVVKANGYGHGDLEVAKVAIDTGAKMLAVSSFDEALHLRSNNFECPILVMGVTDIEDIFIAIKKRISLTAHDLRWIKDLVKLDLEEKLMIHLKIDTGMNRLGLITNEEIAQAFSMLKDHPMIKIEGVYTHMATADSDLTYLNMQVEKFHNHLSKIDLSSVDYVHLANSATLLRFNHSFTQAIRLGISMYGVNSGKELAKLDFEPKPTLALYSTISQCKKINKGDKVGYGATYEATKDEWLGIVPIGYADGWLRKNQGRHVIVDSHKCEIVGRVCMDQLMIRLPKQLPINTKVVLIGDGMPVETVAKELETIEYEVFCLLSDRIVRLYKKEKKLVATRHPRFAKRSK